jgi:steroid delta-isomerase-like uncharacterized protein
MIAENDNAGSKAQSMSVKDFEGGEIMRVYQSKRSTVFLCGVVVLLAAAMLSCRCAEDSPITAELVSRIESVYAEARNTPNLDLLDSIFAEDVIVHDSSVPEDLVGLDALKAYYQGSHDGFPDFRIEFGDVFWADDKIVFIWTIHGTHTGNLRGMPPTNKAVSVSGVAIDRIEDGRIVEEWVYFNLLDLLSQLGMQVVPAQVEAEAEAEAE